MTGNRTTYRNGIDTAVITPRFPLLAEIMGSIKIGAAVGSAVVVIGAAVFTYLQATGWFMEPAKAKDVAELSIKFDGLADKMDREFTALKKDNQRKEASAQAQLGSLQDDMAGVRSEQRAFATAIEELKVKVSAPPPLPTRKAVPRPKTASASFPKSLLIGR